MDIKPLCTENTCYLLPAILIEEMGVGCGNPECSECDSESIMVLYIGWLFWGAAIIFS